MKELFIYHRSLFSYQVICQRETLSFFVVYVIIWTCIEQKQLYWDHLHTVNVYFRLILFVKLFWFILLKNEQVQQVILHVLFYITCIRISSEARLLFLPGKEYALNKYMKIPFSLNLFDQILKAYNFIMMFFTILMCKFINANH